MKHRVDFTETQNFDPVPAGIYSVNVTKATSKDSKKGTPMIEWELTIIGGEYDGKKLRTWTVLAGPGAFNFDNFYEAITGDKPVRDEEGGFEFDDDDFIGENLRVAVLCEDRTDDKAKEEAQKTGKVPQQNSVDEYLPA